MTAARRAFVAALLWLGVLAPAPAHVPIFADVGGKVYDPGPAIVRRYINYARGPLQRRVDASFCPQGTCLPLYYVDPHNIYCGSGTIDWFRAAADRPAWWLHSPSGDQVLNAVTRYGRCPSLTPGSANTYYANYGDAGNQAYWRSYLDAKARAARPSQCYFLDDFTYRLARPSHEISTLDQMLRFEGVELDALAPYCIWTNGLGPGGGRYGSMGAPGGAVPIDAYAKYARAGNVRGVTFEDPLWSAYDRTLRSVNLPVVINTVSRLLAKTRLKIAILDSSADVDGTSLDRVRRLHTAVLWLVTGDSLDRLVSWLDPHTNARNARLTGVYPEQTVVPAHPLKPMGPWAPASSQGSGCRDDRMGPDDSHGGMADLLLACGFDRGNPAGIYAREYGTCYSEARAIGGCAAIVNLEDISVRVDQRRLGNVYRYAIGWSGGPLRGVCPADAGCNGVLDLHSRRLGNTIEIPAQDSLLLAE